MGGMDAANRRKTKVLPYKENNGFLLEPGNADAWRHLITDLLHDPARLRQAGTRARAYTQQNYAWELIAGRYQAILEDELQ